MQKIKDIGFLLSICSLILFGAHYLKMRDYYRDKLVKCKSSYKSDSTRFVKMLEDNTIYIPEDEIVRK